MKNSYLSLSFVALVTTLGLTGCSGLNSFPDASINPQQNSLGTIQGSDYGGHAPLVGAHVYVLQPAVHTAAGNNSNTNYTAQANAYGYQATSLLTSTSSGNGYNTALNSSDPGIPTTWYYETTDSTGRFNISGDYTCTVGLPVYLYLYGGTPQFPSASNTFTISSTTPVNATASGYITFTTTATQNAYIGEQVVLNGLDSQDGLSGLNGSARQVTSVNLTTNTFSIYVGASTAGNYTETGATATFSPTFNPAVVNLAVLGNCPSTGNFTYNTANPSLTPNGLKYVYVNEVSTVAAAYAFRPFTVSSTTGNGDPDGLSGGNNAIYIGTSSTNIAGIQNAALIAGQLYDVQGSNISTTYAGEGHIARSTTTNGNGIVPQANIDTLGNILAACVDSQNTATTLASGGGVGTNMSTQCSTLFNYATLSGVPVSGGGSQPFDTATAAINIARHPAGPPYSYSSTGSSSFMSALYGLPTGNVPFAPNLSTQPNDFTIGIDYTSANNPASGADPYAYTIGAESLAVDKIGNVWVTTQPSPGSFQGYLEEFSPVGVLSNVTYQTNHIYGYVTIDSGQSPWTGSATSVGFYTYQHNTNSGTAVAASGSAPPTYTYGSSTQTGSGSYTYAGVSDSSGNVYFTSNISSGQSTDYIVEFAGAATTPTVTPTTTTGTLTNVNSSSNGMSHGAIDATGAAYFDYNASGTNNGTPQVTRNTLSTAARTSTAWPVTNSTTGCTTLTDPEQLAVVRSGDVIVSDYHNGGGTTNGTGSNLFYITSAGACTALTGASYEAGFSSPFGIAVDGLDYVYVTNRGSNSISVLNTSGGTAASTTSVSPSNGYAPQYVSGTTLTNMLNQPLNIAIDPSGNAWVTDYGNNSVVEIIGVAVPATTPLSAAAIPISYTQGSIGYKP